MTQFCYVCYVTTNNSQHLKELFCSAFSIRKHTKNAKIRVMTNRPNMIRNLERHHSISLFDEVLLIEKEFSYWGDTVAQATFDVLSGDGPQIFIDTDVIVLDDLSLVFRNESNFDVAGVTAPGRNTRGHLRSLITSETHQNRSLNCGLLWINNSEVISRCKDYLQTIFESGSCPEEREITARIPDQVSFEKVLHNSDFNVLTLPSNYNLRICSGAAISGKVYAVHSHFSHFSKDFHRIKPHNLLFPKLCDKIYSRVSKINSTYEPRVYPPSKRRAHIDEYWMNPMKMIQPIGPLST